VQAIEQAAADGFIQQRRDALVGCGMSARSSRQNSVWWCRHLQLRFNVSEHCSRVHLSV